MNRWRAFPILVGLAAAPGCGADSLGLPVEPGPDGGAREEAGPARPGFAADAAAPAATIEQACAESARLCERLAACAPFFVRLVWGDVRTCSERARQSCLDDAAAPGSGLTPASLLACTSALGAASCEDLLNNRIEACAIAGSRAEGAPCGTSSQCASALCRKASGSSCGTCARRADAGGACRENDECRIGLVCRRQTCVAPAALGAVCDERQPCASPLHCKAGVCAPPGGPGEPCTGEDSCDVAHGVVCNTQARTCQTFRAVAAGEACGLLANPPALCAAAGECRPNLVAGVCQAAAGDGEPCGRDAGNRRCLAPATCVDGLCRRPAPASCG